MSVPEVSTQSCISVSEMAQRCQLSRSRFYDLVGVGVFPGPVLHPSSNRPMYDQELQRACLQIRQTGIGANGLPVVFNRKHAKAGSAKVQRATRTKAQDYADLLVNLKGLGLSVTAQMVAEAVAELYPDGLAGKEPTQVIPGLFFHLKARMK